MQRFPESEIVKKLVKMEANIRHYWYWKVDVLVYCLITAESVSKSRYTFHTVIHTITPHRIIRTIFSKWISFPFLTSNTYKNVNETYSQSAFLPYIQTFKLYLQKSSLPSADLKSSNNLQCQ